MAENMTFNADRMMNNAATAAQHRPLMDDPVVQGAVLRALNLTGQHHLRT